jgi:hypothetical protein
MTEHFRGHEAGPDWFHIRCSCDPNAHAEVTFSQDHQEGRMVMEMTCSSDPSHKKRFGICVSKIAP